MTQSAWTMHTSLPVQVRS